MGTNHYHPIATGTTPTPGAGSAAPRLDARAKTLATIAYVAAVALSSPPSLVEFIGGAVALLAVTSLLDGSPTRAARRALIVVPFAGAIALMRPLVLVDGWSWSSAVHAYSVGWPLIVHTLTKAYLSALAVMALNETTPAGELLTGLRNLRVPAVFLTMLTFLLRYTDLFREQVAALRTSVASRAPRVSGWRLVLLYGSLGGNVFVRAYERGEQVYSAMVSRGYTGALPSPTHPRWGRTDSVFLALAILFALAVALYR